MKEADDKFLKIFHNNLIGMLLTDQDHVIIDVNDHMLRLVEFERGAAIGKTVLELGLLQEEFIKGMWQQLADEGELSNIELCFTTKTNKHIDFLFSTERIEIDGSPHWLTT